MSQPCSLYQWKESHARKLLHWLWAMSCVEALCVNGLQTAATVDLDGLESHHSVKAITCCCCRFLHYLKIEGDAPVWDMSCDSILAGTPSTMAPSTSSRHPPNSPLALVPPSGSKYPCLSSSKALAC